MDPILALAQDTLKKGKQALIFVNSKRSAEKTAEDLSKKLDLTTPHLAAQALKALPKPTHQCQRLSTCLTKGVAFHHAGLHAKQKTLIEDAFRTGEIKFICCTPTLAAGLDLPAFRAIIRDVKRFTPNYGMTYIPVLEYLQMSGRAGRPKFDTYGESIIISTTENEKEKLYDQYILGEPEDIYSKLAVEPVLRTYVLSLIAAEFITTTDQLTTFFTKTFWAHQYGDMNKLTGDINNVIETLTQWKFINIQGNNIQATYVGKRISQLYIDPATAHAFITALSKASTANITSLSFLQLISNTPEIRPQLTVKQKEYDHIQEKSVTWASHFLQDEPSMFEPEYDTYLSSIKTASMLHDWIDEKDDEYLMETYDIRPGETRAKLETAKWLLYALTELARINKQFTLLKEINKTRLRLTYGIKEELIPLVKFSGIGRVRARKLYRHGIKDLASMNAASLEILAQIVGIKTAKSLKEQIEGVPEETNNTLDNYTHNTTEEEDA